MINISSPKISKGGVLEVIQNKLNNQQNPLQ